jgi:hypothetical protein
MGQVFSDYFGFPWQFSFHRLLHSSSSIIRDSYIGQLVADVPTGLSHPTPRNYKKKKILNEARSWPNRGTKPDIYLAGLSETTEILNQNNRWPSWNSNLALPEYVTRAVPLRHPARCNVIFMPMSETVQQRECTACWVGRFSNEIPLSHPLHYVSTHGWEGVFMERPANYS